MRFCKDKRAIIALVFPVFLIAGIAFTVYLSDQRQELRREASVGEASLTLSPETKTFEKDQAFDVNILLDTGGLAVVGADVSLSFDVTKLQAQSVTPGATFENQIIFKNETGDGKILLSLGSLTPFTGAEVYGIVRFLTVGTGETSVTFDETPYCKVAQQGGGDILGNAISGTYTVSGPATPTPTPTPVPTVTPTPTPAPTVEPTPIPTPEPEAAHLTFKVKFQGIGQQGPNKTVRLTLKKDGEVVHTEEVEVSSDEKGIYEGLLMNLEPDTYDIFVKGWAHLQKKFENVTLNEGGNAQDWSDSAFRTADADGNNTINIQDFGILADQYRCPDKGPDCPTELTADFGLDGKVNIQDFRFIAENYRESGD